MKYEKFKTMEQFEGTHVCPAVQTLVDSMQNFVQQCPYDIEACTGGQPDVLSVLTNVRAPCSVDGSPGASELSGQFFVHWYRTQEDNEWPGN